MVSRVPGWLSTHTSCRFQSHDPKASIVEPLGARRHVEQPHTYRDDKFKALERASPTHHAAAVSYPLSEPSPDELGTGEYFSTASLTHSRSSHRKIYTALSLKVVYHGNHSGHNFLSYVHVPLTTEIRLKCDFEGHDSLSQLLSYVQKRFSPREAEREGSRPEQPVRSMNIDGAPPWMFFITCSTLKRGYNYRALSCKKVFPPFLSYNYDWDRGIPLKIDLTDNHSTALTETVMVNIFQHLPLAYLQSISVYISSKTEISRIFWRNLFDLARELRFIKLRYITLRGFVTTLAPGHRGWREQSQTLTARALEEIELEQISFASVCVADEEGGIDTCDPTLQCLCDALARRRDAGYPLRRIKISDSWGIGTAEGVDELRGVVGEVKWDGIDNYDFIEYDEA